MDLTTIVSSLISAAAAIIVCVLTNNANHKKTVALVEYKIEQLTQRVEKHNNLIERTYELEKDARIHDEQIKVANHRIADLEAKTK